MGLQAHALDALDDALALEVADQLIENLVGLLPLPLGIATNFVIDGEELLVPMAIEEPSVVAAASYAAKMARAGGGFTTEATHPITIGQIELRRVPDVERARDAIEHEAAVICARGDAIMPRLVERGGGMKGIDVRVLADRSTIVVHLLLDCRDAMGANAVNTVAEAVSPELARLSGGEVGLCILSNLADRRLARASCRIPPRALKRKGLSGEQVRDGIIGAHRFAELDPYRAATHNKGVMNGVDAVILATANDWRAIEAGAHAYAARGGVYAPLSRWWADDEGHLCGFLELPLSVGTVGGATRIHPTARLVRTILRVERATTLARIATAVGLAQNLAALAALGAEGIQQGHMSLVARSRELEAIAALEPKED